MGFIEVVVIGLALSMDAFAVTISNSCAFPHASRSQRLAQPVVFGLFQGIMPLVGYLLGSFAAGVIDQYAGLVSLGILGFIGGRMVWGGSRALLALRKEGGADACGVCPVPAAGSPRVLSFGALLAQGVATSIDALIVGVSLLALDANIAVAAPLIAATTFVCCLVALVLGRRFGMLLGDKAEIAGGVVLILIGIKALF
jgi:putative Mn2+ efflux pump MntP